MIFRKEEAEARLRSQTSGAIENMAPADGIATMLAFWRDTRCDGAAPEEEDGDGLLFQWGTYDWTYSKPPQPKFYLSITRQFSFVTDASDGDVELWHLRLEYELENAPDLANLTRGNEWCFARADLDGFRASIFDSEALKSVERHTPRRIDISFEAV